MNESLEVAASRLMTNSDLVRAVASVRQDGGITFSIGATTLRTLYKLEIAQLEASGNISEDWSRVRVADGFNPRRVRNCEFRGDVVLGEFKKRIQLADSTEVIAGVSNSTLVDCIVGNNALVRDVRLLANYIVAADAVVMDCGRITCTSGTAFGNGARIAVALEGGGREIEVFAEIDVALAAAAACPGPRRPELADYGQRIAQYRKAVTSDRGIIDSGAHVCGVPRLEDTYVGPGANIDGATRITRSTLLSSPVESVVIESGAIIVDSLVQWGCKITGMAIVECSVILEQARVERQGKVLNSVIGPNTEIASGEISSCLLGPFVGCHHQSLLISTLWPSGRGNVGYGANVGSNHTSRAPDQELWAGEGLFFGLGVNVKFPCDFSRADYTVIACGVNLAPQKVTFPFSLITPCKANYSGVPLIFNQIAPAWVLRDNIYAIKRSETKFRARNRTRRNRFDFAVFRKETVEHMKQASRRLCEIHVIQPFYTERHIPGLGKNVMVEADRTSAIEAYEFYIRYYALLGLRHQLLDVIDRGEDPSDLLTTPSILVDWEHQRQILVEGAAIKDVVAGLSALSSMALQIAEDCERTRQKDDFRGDRIIDDYKDVHTPANQDLVVQQAWEEAARYRSDLEYYLRRTTAGPVGNSGLSPRFSESRLSGSYAR